MLSGARRRVQKQHADADALVSTVQSPGAVGKAILSEELPTGLDLVDPQGRSHADAYHLR